MSRFDKPLITLPGPAPTISRIGKGPERRVTPRYPFTAAADVAELQTQTHITGRSSDLGLGGCYIDSISPFSVGTTVRVRLERQSRKFEAMARITYAHISMGMGMVFTEITPEYLPTLHFWVSELSGEPLQVVEAPAKSAGIGLPEILNTRLVLGELIKMLVLKSVITEVEGEALIQMFH